MPNFTLATAAKVTKWSRSYLEDYTRTSGFKAFMGKGGSNVIDVNTDLASDGEAVRIPYIGGLTGAGVTGSTALYGNEEALKNYVMEVRVTLKRNGVNLPESERVMSNLDWADIARGKLNKWSANDLRKSLIAAIQSVPIAGAADGASFLPDTYTTIGSATAGQLNAMNVANSDRVIFGQLNSNYSATYATAIANVTSGQKLTADVLRLAKTKAQATTTSNFAINPLMVDDSQGIEQFVLFVDQNGFRDLAKDATIAAANRDARPREVENNPLFTGGDLYFDGVIIKRIPEMGTVSANVGLAVLCGASAFTVAFSKKPTPRIQSFDFDHYMGVAIMEVRGQIKNTVGGTCTGLVSIYHASVADA